MTMNNYLNDYPNNPLVAALLNLEQLRDADETFDVEEFCYAEVMKYLYHWRANYTNEPICESWFPEPDRLATIEFISHEGRSKGLAYEY